ncbi:MAG: peptide-methionine (S)-S-oxide reductase MsrA [Xanthobacteraceae bacterium]|nr:peptide-methionine (S)-S-oxide reductase MsrA [Xanthobacteraceae bacterium]
MITRRRLSSLLATAAIALPLAATLPLMRAQASSEPVKIEAPKLDAAAADGLQTAVIAGGCFWGIQAVYQHTKGVTKAVSGYAGGEKKDADYERVSSGRTQHAEAVLVTFDPKVISYGKILQIFFSIAHDPTQLNYQGPDHGPQYRTEIFPQSQEQAKVAKAYVAQLDAAKAFKKPIVTKTGTMKAAFYPAEAYHQDYAFRHPNNMYIVINDAPKVENLKKFFPAEFREKPVLVADAN